jgi:hypothetical protein
MKRRLPLGWKHPSQDFYCPACWKQRDVLRAIALPVAQPLDRTIDGMTEECTWADLRVACRAMWRLTTQASNWITRELYVRDAVRSGDQHKMPPMPPLDDPKPGCQLLSEVRGAFSRAAAAQRFESD